MVSLMTRKLVVLSALFLLVGAVIVLADETGGPAPGSQDQPVMPIPSQLEHERNIGTDIALRGQTTGLIIEGNVRDRDGNVLPGVLVKLFGGGTLIEHATTDNEGRYSVSGNPMGGKDVSVLLWLQSPDPERYVDRNYVVQAGPAAEERGLFPACTERIPVMQGRANYNPILLTLQQTKEELEESKCLGAGS
jgi:hypothetical protein